MTFKKIILGILISSYTLLYASWQDIGKSVLNSFNSSANTSSTTNSTYSKQEVTKGLKAALQQGVHQAVQTLGKPNGYFNHPLAKIELPHNLQTAQTVIRKMGGDKYVDNLIKAMNDSATQASVKTTSIFIQAIENMSITDAYAILQGESNAATNYFKTHTFEELKRAIEPIVKQSMQKNQIANYYKKFNDFYENNARSYINDSTIGSYAKNLKLESYLPLSKEESFDEYITKKAIDGLFIVIENEEKAIRENPIEQTNTLIKKIFSK